MSLKKRYDHLIATIDSAKIYNGRGTYDTYVCLNCGHELVTTYKDYGVTPFTVQCPKCEQSMIHERTSATKPDTIVQNWVRPTFGQFVKLNSDQQQHVLNGVLMLESELSN
jgi:transcription elongation factor Elf1